MTLPCCASGLPALDSDNSLKTAAVLKTLAYQNGRKLKKQIRKGGNTVNENENNVPEDELPDEALDDVAGGFPGYTHEERTER